MMLVAALERESSSVVGRFSKIDTFVSRYESRPTDALFAPADRYVYRIPVRQSLHSSGAQCVWQSMSNPSLQKC